MPAKVAEDAKPQPARGAGGKVLDELYKCVSAWRH
jgi:hypothetical protein